MGDAPVLSKEEEKAARKAALAAKRDVRWPSPLAVIYFDFRRCGAMADLAAAFLFFSFPVAPQILGSQ